MFPPGVLLDCLTPAKAPSLGFQIFFLKLPVLFKGGFILPKDAKFRPEDYLRE